MTEGHRFRRPRLVLAGVVAAVAVPGGVALPALFGSPASADASSCAIPASVSAAPDTSLDDLFTQYGNSSVGWTGADGVHSVGLSNGTVLWTFADTFLGRVTANGVRNVTVAPYVHNSIVEQDPQGNLWTTLVRARPTGKPSAFLSPVPAQPIQFGYWPGASMVQGGLLYMLAGEYQFKKKSFAFRSLGDSLLTLWVPTLGVQSITKLPAGSIDFTDSIFTDGTSTYVYGYAGGNGYVATMDPTNPASGWQYFTGSGWSANESDAQPIAIIGGGFSVSQLGDAYVLVGSPPNDLESGDIEVSFACSPTGPFTTPSVVYQAPEVQSYPASYGAIVYDAHAEPAANTPPGTLVVSYDVNAPGSKRAMSTASLYRPRYVTLTFGY